MNIAHNCGVSEYTVFDIVTRVSGEICEQLMPKYITWPEEERVNEFVNGVRNHRGFSGVIHPLKPIRATMKTTLIVNHLRQLIYKLSAIQIYIY